MKAISLFAVLVFLKTCAFAGVAEDIQTLKAKAEDFYTIHGRYFEGAPTPAQIPQKGANLGTTELNKKEGETETFAFTPSAKDYQYWVVKWTSKINFSSKSGRAPVLQEGYRVVARQKDSKGNLTEIQDGMFPLELQEIES